MEIFWIKDGAKQGPLPVVEIISEIERGSLSENDKGWHIGCSSWLPLKELPALESYFKKTDTPDLDELPSDFPEAEASFDERYLDPSPSPQTKIIIIPTPFMRALAKVIDLACVFVFALLPVYLFKLPFLSWYLNSIPFLLIPYETFCLHLYGTTIGKRLLNIYVATLEEEKPGWKSSLMRSIDCFIMGLGMMWSFFAIILPIFSWVLVKKRGIAPWDMRQKTVPYVAARVTPLHIVLCIWVAFLISGAINFLFGPWQEDYRKSLPPEVQEIIERFLDK